MSAAQRPSDLIYDWNVATRPAARPAKPIEFDDETLRDGLQSPSANDPDLDAKMDLVRRMAALGITTADVGLPGAGPRARHHIETLVRMIQSEKLPIGANVACRTVVTDIQPAAELVQKTGFPLEVCAFIGSSPIRQYAEGWELKTMLENVRAAISFCRKEKLSCMFVTEDTTRAHPDTIRALYHAAIEEGARRICVCDTCGHVTPDGVRALLGYVKQIVKETGHDVKIDWHGHRDRGLGVANCIAAIEAGADRIHATALGVGERAGNAEMDLLLVNLKLLGWIDQDLRPLRGYVDAASKAIGIPVPHNYPVFGDDAFETGTGVHASAVVKAFRMGDAWLANRVYSGVPADDFGLEQKIGIGPMSGKSNVQWVLEKRGVAPTDELVKRLLDRAKGSTRLLTDAEIDEVCRGASA
ncbi:MAG: 2-isopropylmalate synthase [Planctomycetes bacterium]|nr:2-isopropylmalate synthase [Planctomycetota bacterium]